MDVRLPKYAIQREAFDTPKNGPFTHAVGKLWGQVMTNPPPSLAARVRAREAKCRADVAECLADNVEADASNAKAGKVTNFAGEECADCEKAKVDAELLRECAEALKAKDQSLAAAAKLVDDWREAAREAARLARPLESGELTAEKRKRIEQWMFYSGRANELAAALRERR